MKLAAVTPVYNEERLIRGCIESLRPYVQRHIVCVGEKPYYGNIYIPDRTAEIAESLGADVIRGEWPLDHQQRNTGIMMLQDYDWIITTDADMWMTKEDMRNLISELSEPKADAYVIPQIGYWKDTSHYIENEFFMPVIAIRPHVRFVHIGNVGCSYAISEKAEVHHLAWCEPKDIYKKVTTYSHAPEFNGHDWYEKHYKTWNPSMKTATLPDNTYNIAECVFPEELNAYL